MPLIPAVYTIPTAYQTPVRRCNELLHVLLGSFLFGGAVHREVYLSQESAGTCNTVRIVYKIQIADSAGWEAGQLDTESCPIVPLVRQCLVDLCKGLG